MLQSCIAVEQTSKQIADRMDAAVRVSLIASSFKYNFPLDPVFGIPYVSRILHAKMPPDIGSLFRMDIIYVGVAMKSAVNLRYI